MREPVLDLKGSLLADSSNGISGNFRVAASVLEVFNRAKSLRLSQESSLPQTRAIKMANKVLRAQRRLYRLNPSDYSIPNHNV